MYNMKKLSFNLLGIAISHFGAALGALVNIGQGPVSAFYLTGSYLTGIQIGMIAIFFQSIFIIGQLVIERRNFKPIQLFQILNIVFGGMLLNFFLYDIFGGVVINSYILRLILGTISFAINAMGVVLTLQTEFIRVPLEGFLQLVAEKKQKKLGRFKQIFDIALISLSLIICIILHLPITIREGTVINAIIFGAVLDLTKKPIRKLYLKLQVITEDK